MEMVLAYWYIRVVGCFDLETIELLTLKMGLKIVEELGLLVGYNEYEATNIPSLLSMLNPSYKAIGLVADIKVLLSAVSGGTCLLILCHVNGVAHALAYSITKLVGDYI